MYKLYHQITVLTFIFLIHLFFPSTPYALSNLPYGDTYDNLFPNQTENIHDYTGKELDEDTGLHYYGARYYNAKLGRFMSVDPVGGNILDPQSFNKYPYVLNNPFKYVDPDGRDPVSIFTITASFLAAKLLATLVAFPSIKGVQETAETIDPSIGNNDRQVEGFFTSVVVLNTLLGLRIASAELATPLVFSISTSATPFIANNPQASVDCIVNLFPDSLPPQTGTGLFCFGVGNEIRNRFFNE